MPFSAVRHIKPPEWAFHLQPAEINWLKKICCLRLQWVTWGRVAIVHCLPEAILRLFCLSLSMSAMRDIPPWFFSPSLSHPSFPVHFSEAFLIDPSFSYRGFLNPESLKKRVDLAWPQRWVCMCEWLFAFAQVLGDSYQGPHCWGKHIQCCAEGPLSVSAHSMWGPFFCRLRDLFSYIHGKSEYSKKSCIYI